MFHLGLKYINKAQTIRQYTPENFRLQEGSNNFDEWYKSETASHDKASSIWYIVQKHLSYNQRNSYLLKIDTPTTRYYNEKNVKNDEYIMYLQSFVFVKRNARVEKRMAVLSNIKRNCISSDWKVMVICLYGMIHWKEI